MNCSTLPDAPKPPSDDVGREVVPHEKTLWKRFRFQGNKIWVIVNGEGEPVLDIKGQVQFAYKQDALQQYTTYPDRIDGIDEQKEVETRVARPHRERRRGRRLQTHHAGTSILSADDPRLAEVRTDRVIELWPLANLGDEETRWTVRLVFREHARVLSGTLQGKDLGLAVLTALGAGLDAIKTPERRLIVHTASAFVVGVLAQGWKPRERARQVREVQKKLGNFADVFFHQKDARAEEGGGTLGGEDAE